MILRPDKGYNGFAVFLCFVDIRNCIFFPVIRVIVERIKRWVNDVGVLGYGIQKRICLLPLVYIFVFSGGMVIPQGKHLVNPDFFFRLNGPDRSNSAGVLCDASLHGGCPMPSYVKRPMFDVNADEFIRA